MDKFNNLTVLSLEQATVVPYLTYRLVQDGMEIIRLEHPIYGDPNRFIGENVLNQLEENARVFLNDGSKNRLDKDSKILYLSSIFKWFQKSFEERFGSLEQTAKNFINENYKKFLNENEIEIKFLKYNWKLNSQ